MHAHSGAMFCHIFSTFLMMCLFCSHCVQQLSAEGSFSLHILPLFTRRQSRFFTETFAEMAEMPKADHVRNGCDRLVCLPQKRGGFG